MGVDVKGSSARLNEESRTIVAAHETIRPLRDQMIVEPIEVDHGVSFLVREHKRPLRGIVKAIGPGCYPNKYDHHDKHQRTKVWKAKHFLQTEVKVGDIVELGMVDGDGYNFQTFLWGDKLHLICRELDVAGVESNEQEQSVA